MSTVPPPNMLRRIGSQVGGAATNHPVVASLVTTAVERVAGGLPVPEGVRTALDRVVGDLLPAGAS